MIISIIAFIAAIAIASVAAWFSIIGLVALFPGAALSIAIMAATLEVGKLVTASWLYRNWKQTHLLLKTYLVIAVIVLMFITSLGVFGYLSKSYLAHNAPLAAIDIEVRNYASQIATLESDLVRNQQVLAQLDDSVNRLIEFSRISGPNGAIAVRESQRDERNIVHSEITSIQHRISDIQQRVRDIETDSIDVRSKLGPAEYIASFIYGDGDNSVDRAVQLIILMIVLVFDPLAVLLLIAANQGLMNGGEKGRPAPESVSVPQTDNDPVAMTNATISYDDLVQSLTEPRKSKTRKKRTPKRAENTTAALKPEDSVEDHTEELNNSVKSKKTPNAVWIKNNKTE